MEVLIIGHQNPDTDSVVAALAYAELKNKLDRENHYQAGVAGSLNNETKFVLRRFRMPALPLFKSLTHWKGKVIILDHTEPAQSPPGLEGDKIIEVLDHHRLGGLQTSQPLFVRVEPLGSTSTLVAKIFRENKLKPTKKVAGLLISGIISDTLYLQSPTTTDDDRKLLVWLNKIAGLGELKTYATSLFKAKSDITGIPLTTIITKDYKEFQFGSKKVGIGVWETVDPESILSNKEKITIALKRLKEKHRLDLLYFMVVDILKQKSEMIIIDTPEEEVARKVFGGEVVKNLLSLGGRVSRKKEIVPPLEKFLK